MIVQGETPMKRLYVSRLSCLLALTSVWAIAIADDGVLQKSFSRREMLEYIAAPIPVTFYDPAFTKVIPDSLGKQNGVILKVGQISLTPFSPDWLPLSGSSFNKLPYQSIAPQIIRGAPSLSSSELISPQIRTMVDSYLAGIVGEADPSSPLPVITKLAFLESQLNKSNLEFNFGVLTGPHVKFRGKGSVEEKYYSAVTDRDVYYFFDPGVPDWWGFCDRGAIANLNPESSRIRNAFGGGFCGPVPVSSFDVEDMLAFLQPMEDSLHRYGANRGNITDEQSLSPEVILFEETLGDRPLSPEEFIRLLHENVRASGPGLIIDESSDPRDPVYGAASIWNRPVFAYSETEAAQDIPIRDLSQALLIRYADALSKWTGVDARALLEATGKFRTSAGANDAALNAWYEAEYTKRALEKGFKQKEQVLTSQAPTEMEGRYKASRRDFLALRKRVMDLADSFHSELKKNQRIVSLRVKKIKVFFPRQRKEWSYGSARLYAEPMPRFISRAARRAHG